MATAAILEKWNVRSRDIFTAKQRNDINYIDFKPNSG